MEYTIIVRRCLPDREGWPRLVYFAGWEPLAGAVWTDDVDRRDVIKVPLDHAAYLCRELAAEGVDARIMLASDAAGSGWLEIPRP
jgi:hypothetical protein